MRTVSLEKQIAGIINNGKVISKEDFGKESEIRTIESGNFKCSAPMEYVAELLANARRMSRKKPERYPVPKTQNILAFLSNNRDVIPYFVKMVEKGKSVNWFKQQICLNFPETANQILKDAVYGNKANMQYACDTMPPACKAYADREICKGKH